MIPTPLVPATNAPTQLETPSPTPKFVVAVQSSVILAGLGVLCDNTSHRTLIQFWLANKFFTPGNKANLARCLSIASFGKPAASDVIIIDTADAQVQCFCVPVSRDVVVFLI